jgi:hypothetical protein
MASKTSEKPDIQKKSTETLDTRCDMQEIINKVVKPSQKPYENSLDRSANFISDITRQSLNSNSKVIDRHPSTKPKPAAKPLPKERIYASNFLEPSTSLTTGSRILHTSSNQHEPKSAKPASKRQTISAMNMDVISDVYLGYHKGSLQSGSLIEQLIAKPQVTKIKKSKRTKELKSNIEMTTSPIQKQEKNTRHAAIGGLSRDSIARD